MSSAGCWADAAQNVPVANARNVRVLSAMTPRRDTLRASSSICGEDRMNRREFIAGTTALLVSPRRSWAQGTPRRVGYLDPVPKNFTLKAWLDSLRDHGWI